MNYILRYSILGSTYRKSFATVGEALRYSIRKIPLNSFIGIDKAD
jgi:hypothetical protein